MLITARTQSAQADLVGQSHRKVALRPHRPYPPAGSVQADGVSRKPLANMLRKKMEECSLQKVVPSFQGVAHGQK